MAPLDFIKLKGIFEKWQTQLYGCGWNSLFWDNHDLPRIVSRWGNDNEYRVKSAKMLATLLHGMQGTPYIYQGEELGMTNICYDIQDYRDIETVNLYHERLEKGYKKEDIMKSIHVKSRDNARTPMQWSASDYAGFSTTKPWIRINPNYIQINAESQLQDPDSIFYYYQKLIQLRKEYSIFINGQFQLYLKEDPDIMAYTRTFEDEVLFIICNFHNITRTIDLPIEIPADHQLLISNYNDSSDASTLRPYESMIYYFKK